jgi:O-antigen/teichoic acid export membrane protein
MTGMAIGVAVGGLGAIVMSRSLVVHRPSATMTRSLLRLGLPLVPALAALWIGDFANRAILLEAGGSSEVGFLSVAVRFGSLGVLVVTGFQLAWLPQAFAQGASPAGLARIAVDARRIVVTVCVAIVPMAVFAPELLRLVAGPAYRDALGAIGFSLVTTIGLALFVVAGMPSSLSRTMRDLGIAGTVGALAGVALNVGFARQWGAAGTSAALAAGQFIGVGLLLMMGRRRAAVPLDWKMITLTAGAGVVASLSCTLPSDLALVPRLVVGALFTLVLVLDGSARELAVFAREWRTSRKPSSAHDDPDENADTSSRTPST